jgi:hypothetical protein
VNMMNKKTNEKLLYKINEHLLVLLYRKCIMYMIKL